MADLNPISVRSLEAFGGKSPKLTDGQVNYSESDDEKNDEAGVEEGENHGGRLKTKLLTGRKLLKDYSFKKEEKEKKAKKEESDSIYSHDSELTSSSSVINTLPG